MGHAVLTAERLNDVVPFYTEILNFKPTDHLLQPFKAYFFHINARHHSLAFIDTGKNGIHHMMFEVCYLDDVGQAYDLALRKPETIASTFGRHVNDHVTSFYSYSPSKFMVEYGWGGRSIDTANWTPHERTEGPSLWGHDRMWLTPEKREDARSMRVEVAAAAAASRSTSWTAIICAPPTSARGGTPTCRRARPGYPPARRRGSGYPSFRLELDTRLRGYERKISSRKTG